VYFIIIIIGHAMGWEMQWKTTVGSPAKKT